MIMATKYQGPEAVKEEIDRGVKELGKRQCLDNL
jgi:hypothetical protein